tara:strand:+ start:2018 stop:2464 length:447 start_codon:yes stop_codon:yes gene_type:complete
MKVNYTHLASFLVAIILSIWLMFLISCSPNYHMRKFIKKGGKINNDTTIVTLTDTIKGKDGKDSIIYRQVSVECPELIAPPTRFEIRYRYKTVHDSLTTIKYITKYKYKEAVKTLKNTKKRGWGYNLRFLGVIVGLLIIIVYLLRTNK